MMQHWVVALLILIAVLAAGWYLSYTAARLDRLHARVEGSLSALDAKLIRRGEVAMEIATSPSLDAASALLLASAASDALEAGEETLITSDVQEHGLSSVRCECESALTHAIAAVIPNVQLDRELKRRLADASERVSLAHRFHNEAVRDARRVRERYLVRICHLAGHTQMPHIVEFDD